jgi:hypothetical protein
VQGVVRLTISVGWGCDFIAGGGSATRLFMDVLRVNKSMLREILLGVTDRGFSGVELGVRFGRNRHSNHKLSVSLAGRHGTACSWMCCVTTRICSTQALV